MIIKVRVEAWHCTACGHTWIPRKDETKKLRCANRKCKRTAGYTGKTVLHGDSPILQNHDG